MKGLSVIIPTLNEAETAGALLAQLNEQQDIQLEIIVADGGSTDQTLAIAAEKGARTVTSAPGRGRQMNAGAEMASLDHLLFLHCDSLLTSKRQLRDGLDHLEAGYRRTRRLAGHFSISFVTEDRTLKSRLGYFEKKTRLNRPGTFNGDQGLMISRPLFHELERFSEELPFLEDQEFAERFRAEGIFTTLPTVLETSARRFEQEGFGRRVILNALIMGMFHIRSTAFFDRAPGVYREQNRAGRLALGSFFPLALKAVFADGILPGIRNAYRIGRYATGNLWQLFLYIGGEGKLRIHDRYAAPVLGNPLGYLVGTVAVAAWFLAAWPLVVWLERRECRPA